MNRTLIIIAALLIATLFACAKPAKVITPEAQFDKDDAYYGKALGIKLGEDAIKAGKYIFALVMLNDGLWFLRKANLVERCGTSRVRCIVYKVYGIYLRAMAYAMSGNAEKALEDLNWIHENGYMKFLVKYYKFWKEPKFGGIKDNPGFQDLVRTYRK